MQRKQRNNFTQGTLRGRGSRENMQQRTSAFSAPLRPLRETKKDFTLGRLRGRGNREKYRGPLCVLRIPATSARKKIIIKGITQTDLYVENNNYCL